MSIKVEIMHVEFIKSVYSICMKQCSKCKENHESKNSWCNPCRAELEKQRRRNKGIKELPKPIIQDQLHKECLICHEIFHIDLFNKATRGILNRKPYCKKCDSEYHKNRKKEHPELHKEKHREYTQKYRNEHREHWRGLHRINQFNRKNTKKAQSDGTITEEFMKEIYATKECFWCKKYIPIDERTAEHITPLNKGGIHGVSNLTMACLSCNSSKLNFE